MKKSRGIVLLYARLEGVLLILTTTMAKSPILLFDFSFKCTELIFVSVLQGWRRFTVLKQLINLFYHHWDDEHTAVATFWLLFFLCLMYFRPSPNVSHSQLKRLLWIHTSFAPEVAVATTVSTWAECFRFDCHPAFTSVSILFNLNSPQ